MRAKKMAQLLGALVILKDDQRLTPTPENLTLSSLNSHAHNTHKIKMNVF